MRSIVFSFAAAFATATLSSPSPEISAHKKCPGISGPVLNSNFADPSLLLHDDTWYSFATSNGGDNQDLQGAKSTTLDGKWSKLEGPILAIDEIKWAGNRNGSYGIWAPDVFQRYSDKKFVMYFSAYDKETISKNKQHCIGAAISDDITGVYHPVNDFVQCNRTSNGVIDPAWFRDDDEKQYIVYKTDMPAVWLEIREVTSSGPKEGVEWASNAQKLLKISGQGFDDGMNLEAPYIFKRGGIYFLAYSTHYYADDTYDVQYATAKHVRGPYTRVKEPLLETTDACGLIGPGSASFQRVSWGNEEVVNMVFHGLRDNKRPISRPLYTATVQVNGTRLFFN